MLKSIRSETRNLLRAPCRLRSGPGLARTAVLVDLTAQGCKVARLPKGLHRGQTVTLAIGSVAEIKGEVRWLDNAEEAGIRFVRPLGQATFSSLMSIARQARVLSEGISAWSGRGSGTVGDTARFVC